MKELWLMAVSVLMSCLQPVSDQPAPPQKRLVFTSPTGVEDVDSTGKAWWFYGDEFYRSPAGRIAVTEGFYFIDGLAAPVDPIGGIGRPPKDYQERCDPSNSPDGWFRWDGAYFKYTAARGERSLRTWRVRGSGGEAKLEASMGPRFAHGGTPTLAPRLIWGLYPLRGSTEVPTLCVSEAEFPQPTNPNEPISPPGREFTYLTTGLTDPTLLTLHVGLGPGFGKKCLDGFRSADGVVVLAGSPLQYDEPTDLWVVLRAERDGGVTEESLPAARAYLPAHFQPADSVVFGAQLGNSVRFWRSTLFDTRSHGEAHLSPDGLLLAVFSADPPLVLESLMMDGGYGLSACGRADCRQLHVASSLRISVGVSDAGSLLLAEQRADAGIDLWEFPQAAWRPQ